MSLFPSCTFRIDIPGGRAIPGQRLDAALVLYAAEAIPRAQHLDLVFESNAWAGYGAGKSRTVVRRRMFAAPLHIPLPQSQPFAAGFHHYPFSIDLPAWLPPAYIGDDCAIEHTFRTHLDVDWAVDPKATMALTILRPPQEAIRRGTIVRSPLNFDSDVVVEVTLESTVIAENEAIRGQIAIRSGHKSNFRGLGLAIATQAKVAMARGDRRLVERSTLFVPQENLVSGDAVSFSFPPIPNLATTFRSNFIDNDVVLLVSLDRPWVRDPRFSIALTVLPLGSNIYGEGTTNVLGGERLRRLGASMANATGLASGDHAPTLVHGKIGSTTLTLLDAPRGAHLGVDVDILFPDVELGIVFRSRRLLDGAAPLLPAGMADFFLRCEPQGERPALPEAALQSFLKSTLDLVVGGASELRLSDHHLGAHVPVISDDEARMVEIARQARQQAEQIASAIAALPFPPPLAAARPAWEATATEQNAMLVPTSPTLHGLVFRARVADGEERSATVTLRTMWTTTTPTLQADVSLEHAAIPENALKQLESDAPIAGLVAVRAHFEIAHAGVNGKSATLVNAKWAEDPRSLFPALEAFFAWVLDARGERRVENPYR